MVRAQVLELLGPESTVSPDGFQVAVRWVDAQGKTLDAKAAVLDATGATVSGGRPEGPLRIFSLPPTGDRQVTVKASAAGATASRVFAVGPPAAGVSLKL